jgi:hypothetical protein
VKRRIVDRYERTPDGEIIIDVGVGTVEDLYEDFDRTASYLKKDLDEDFVAYLIECVKEIPREPFRIRISLKRPESDERMQRVQDSIQSYFLYVRELETGGLRRLFRRWVTLTGLGIILIIGSLRVRYLFPDDVSLPVEVLGEGVTVAAWVALWSACETLIFDWGPVRQSLRIYNRILRAPVDFRNGA